MGHERSIVDPCMCFSRKKAGEFAIWLSWIDDNLIVGPLQVVKNEGKKLAKEIEIRDVGELKEFIGYKIKVDKLEQLTKFTQPVITHSFLDKFGAGKRSKDTSRTNHSSKKARTW